MRNATRPMTPLAVVAAGLLAGAVGTIGLDAVHDLKYRRARGAPGPAAWEFAPVKAPGRCSGPGTGRPAGDRGLHPARSPGPLGLGGQHRRALGLRGRWRLDSTVSWSDRCAGRVAPTAFVGVRARGGGYATACLSHWRALRNRSGSTTRKRWPGICAAPISPMGRVTEPCSGFSPDPAGRARTAESNSSRGPTLAYRLVDMYIVDCDAASRTPPSATRRPDPLDGPRAHLGFQGWSQHRW